MSHLICLMLTVTAGKVGIRHQMMTPHDVPVAGPAAVSSAGLTGATQPVSAAAAALNEPGSHADEDADAEDAQGADGGEGEDMEGDEGGTPYWLADPPDGFGRQLSQFGRLFSALDGWVTDATLRHLRARPGRPAGQAEVVPPAEFAQVGRVDYVMYQVCHLLTACAFAQVGSSGTYHMLFRLHQQ